MDYIRQVCLRAVAVLLLCAVLGPAAAIPSHPLEIQQTGYEMRVGESAQVAAAPDTLDFLLKAKTLRVQAEGASSNWVAAPNRAHDRVLVAAPLRTSPGEYTAHLSATSATGEERTAAMKIVIKPMQTVPSGSARNPVVLLNGWETGFTGTCTVSSSSSDTFGNLAQYLISDGVPIVYFFDNCAVDPNQTIEGLGNDLATFLNTIKYDNGDQVPQIDLVGFSMGGLIARAYLAGLQPDETATPPAPTLVQNLILIATPNFGSFVAGNYATILAAEEGTQSAELIPASSLLWNLATWNQRGDDLRGVNALAIIGNAGVYLASLSATTQLNKASDGLVSETSASLGFALLASTPTQIVPYCHVDPSAFTNTEILGTFLCNAAGIANVTSETQETGEIVRSFLAGTTNWQSIGGTAAQDPWLSKYGGEFFGLENQTGSYATDLTGAAWGSVALTDGGDTDIIYYTDFISGSGDFVASSTSLGTVDCGGPFTAPVGFSTAARCKLDTAIYDVTPHNAPGWTVTSGSTITLAGTDFGDQCTSCQVLAIPAGSSTATALQVSSWTETAITATLPATFTGLVTLQVNATPGTDAITIMAAAPGATIAATPASLQFAYTAGGAVPAAQSIQIANSGSGTLAWTATASQSWLGVSSTSGTAPSTLSISISPASLSAGTYNGTVTITASGATNSPLTVVVTLTVTAAVVGPTLAAAPQALTFSYTVGSAVPPAQTVSITNTGSGAFSWTATSNAFWITLSAASGSAPATLSVSVNPYNLAAGNQTGTVQIAAAGAAGSPVSIAVTLVVTGTQPVGNITAVVNGGSFQSGFAAATWVSIYGTNLSASVANWNGNSFTNGALPTSVDGVSVTINGIPAYVDYVSPTQINALAPDDPTTGAVQVVVTAAGQPSSSFTAQKQHFSPAFFTFDNGKYVAAEHADYSLLGAAGLIPGATTTPAQPGETILMFGTGFGPTNPPLPTGTLVTTSERLANNVTFTIGGMAANVAFAGLVESGLDQFNVTVPANLPSGDAAVIATIGGVETQTGVSITIQ